MSDYFSLLVSGDLLQRNQALRASESEPFLQIGQKLLFSDGAAFEQRDGTHGYVLMDGAPEWKGRRVRDCRVADHALLYFSRIDIDPIEYHHLIRAAAVNQLAVRRDFSKVTRKEPTIRQGSAG